MFFTFFKGYRYNVICNNTKDYLSSEPKKINVKFHKNCENTDKIVKISCVRCHFVKFDINIIFLGSRKKFSSVLLQVTNKYYIYSPWCDVVFIILVQGFCLLKIKLLYFLMDSILNVIELHISPKNWSSGYIHAFSSLRCRSNLQVLTLACNRCEASPRSLLWISQWTQKIPELYFEFSSNPFGQSNMCGTQLGDPEEECWRWLTDGLVSSVVRVNISGSTHYDWYCLFCTLV